MEPIIICQGITVEELIAKIDSIVQQRVQEKISQLQQEQQMPTYLSRKQVAQLLKISLPTLHEWTKLGLIPSYKIGNRVYYKSNEVKNSLVETKYLK
jgi:excisionase family DNA binding protein